MQIVTVGLGLLLLILGRKMFWLGVAILGFFFGMAVAGTVLVDQPAWVTLLVGLGAGLLGGLLAMLAQRVAFAIAGGYAGAYLALSAAAALGFGGHRTLWVVAGGVIGAVLAARIMDWALIALTSLVGAGAIVNAVSLGQTTGALLFVGLTVVGMAVQRKLMRPGPTTGHLAAR
jgi:Domain of unknown function (DUF4203)